MTTAAPGAEDGHADAPEDRPVDTLLAEAFELLPDAVSISVAVRDAGGRAVDLRLEYANATARTGHVPGAAPAGGPCGTLWSRTRTAGDGVFATCLDVLNTGLPEHGAFTPVRKGVHRTTGHEYRVFRLRNDRLMLVLRTDRYAQAPERTRPRPDGEGGSDDGNVRERLRILADAGALLGASLDREATFDAVTGSVVPSLADGCLLYLTDDTGHPVLAALAHRDPCRRRELRDLTEAFLPHPDAQGGVGAVIRTGRHERGTDVTRALVPSPRPGEGRRTQRRPSPADPWLTVPVARSGTVVGAVVLVRSAPGRSPFTEEDVRLARELSCRATPAIENARHHTEQAEVARRLQESLLPRALPDVPGLELSALHHPGQKGTLMGGDFYDVFPSGPRSWTVTVGDVAGKGPQAAALTGLVRHTVRATGRSTTEPAALLHAVNTALLDEPPSTRRFCTTACATLRPHGSGMRLTLALGGHPHPLLRRSDGTVVPVGRPGTLLGVVNEPRLLTVHHELEPGDLLLFYTDGVTEHRSNDVMLGEAGVHAVLARTPGASAEATVRLLAEEIAAYGPRAPADDFALLGVRVR
ncbi:PP2C family protein-serine/threonine phosphatase [Streptomyces bikiniensis]|uniref:PP2C family protein-serine/threonine phosphatase n=1 Tax=Streptomyces bikiniensis TaxID=1896 RepID=UPI0004C227D7|nr:GAF domain-containing SpoIIE family protein phosphatase [Streptomyces bikiniensis]